MKYGDDSHQEIRPLLLVLGGGMRGVSGAGAMLYLLSMDLRQAFDQVVGISTGAAISAYFLSGIGPSSKAISIYYYDLPGKFITFRCPPRMNLDYVIGLMEKGDKRVDVEKVINARPDFYVVATEQNGEPRLIDVKKNESGIFEPIRASMSVPNFTKPVEIGGEILTDGCANPFPAEMLVEKFKPTDMLVIANCSEREAVRKKSSFFRALCSRVFLGSHWSKSYKRWNEGFKYLEKISDVNAAIIWSPSDMHVLGNNKDKLKKLSMQSIIQAAL